MAIDSPSVFLHPLLGTDTRPALPIPLNADTGVLSDEPARGFQLDAHAGVPERPNWNTPWWLPRQPPQFRFSDRLADLLRQTRPIQLTPLIADLRPMAVKAHLYRCLSPAGAVAGAVVASPSAPFWDPHVGAMHNYFRDWTRDGALVWKTLLDIYSDAGASEQAWLLERLQEFIALTAKKQNTVTPSGDALRRRTGQAGPIVEDSGEPLFEAVLPSGQTIDNFDDAAKLVNHNPWGRPQDDGPPLRALALIAWREELLCEGRQDLADKLLPLIDTDLRFTAKTWPRLSTDCWEETPGHHFYTRLAQRRALLEGAKLARELGHTKIANAYQAKARRLTEHLQKHWDEKKGHLLAAIDVPNTGGIHSLKTKSSQLDIQILLGVLHTRDDNDDFFGVTDDRVLATAQHLIDVFNKAYPINHQGLAGTVLGRYPEDRFFGGNGWVLATNAIRELYTRAAERYFHAGQILITPRNRAFFAHALKDANLVCDLADNASFNGGSAEFSTLIAALQFGAEAYAKRIRFHAHPDGRLAEQIDKNTGFMASADPLGWSHVSEWTAQRAEARLKALLHAPEFG